MSTPADTSKTKKTQNYERQDYGGKIKLETVSIKVPREMRQHWQMSARARATSLSAIIVKLLTKEFGEVQ